MVLGVKSETLGKVIDITIILCVLSLISCLIAWHLGYDGLLLVGNIELPQMVRNIILGSILFIQNTIIFSISLQVYNNTIFKYMKTYIIIYLITRLIPPWILHPMFNTVVIPFVSIMVVAYKTNIGKETFNRWLVLNIKIVLLQIPMLFIKIGVFNLTYNYLGFYQCLMLNIDFTIFMLLFYFKGGKDYVGLGRQCLVLSASRKISKSSRESNVDTDALTKTLNKYRGWQLALAITILMTTQIIQWSFIMLVCSIGNVFIEGITITTSFVIISMILKTKLHNKTILLCTLVSTVIFYTAAKVIPSYGYSQLLPVLTGVAIAFGSYYVACYYYEHEWLKNKVQELSKKEDI